MKKTALTRVHEALGAKLLDYAGFLMPIEYSGIREEHLNVRQNAGIFDVSHMGEFLVKGDNAKDFLQKITTNNIELLVPGKAQYSCLPNEKGGIVDDLIIYMLNPDEYLLVVNAANIEKDWNWINRNNEEEAQLENVSDQYSMLAVQGPRAIDILQKTTNYPIKKIPPFRVIQLEMASIEGVIYATTGYTGAGGAELIVPNQKIEILWNAIIRAGENENIKPIGLAARDTLRIEMGYPLYGNDIDDDTSPVEASLNWIVRLNEKNRFIGQDLIKDHLHKGVKHRLVGFELEERGIPRKGYQITGPGDDQVGIVTSGTISPVLNKGIGLGYVTSEIANPGNFIYINIRNKKIKAKIVKLPFIK